MTVNGVHCQGGTWMLILYHTVVLQGMFLRQDHLQCIWRQLSIVLYSIRCLAFKSCKHKNSIVVMNLLVMSAGEEWSMIFVGFSQSLILWQFAFVLIWTSFFLLCYSNRSHFGLIQSMGGGKYVCHVFAEYKVSTTGSDTEDVKSVSSSSPWLCEFFNSNYLISQSHLSHES